MGKIKVLKKSTLSGRTENDDYKIYPVTKTDAVFTDGEDKDECDTQTPQGANKTAKEIFNSIRKKGWVNNERIKDGAVTSDKLGAEVIELISNATGVPENLVKEMEQWNNRIAALESDKLTSKVVIYAPDVVEYIPNNSSSSITIQLQNARGIISKDTNYTNKHLYYNINNRGEVDVQDDNVNVEYKYDAPAQVNIEARGTATYKGVPITFPVVRKTIYAVLPSYIGYIEDYNNWNNTGTKLIKHSLNGQYNVVNPYDLAYLVVAIPKNGMVLPINSIIQKGTLDAVQQYDVIDKDNYTLYVCKTKHNKGTYNIKLLGTLTNSDESDIISNASQIYDDVVQSILILQERITDLDKKIGSGSGSDENLKYKIIKEV